MYELVTAGSFMGIYFVYGLTFTTFVYIAVTSILIIGSGIDLDYHFIPDFLSVTLIPLSIVTAIIAQTTDRLPDIMVNHTFDALIGILVGGGVVWIVRFIGGIVFQQEAMGFGDVKHLAGLGGFLGWEYVLVCFFLASFYGSLVGVPMKYIGKGEKYKHIPFIPYLSLGAYSCVLFGKPLLNWYLSQFYGGY
jgi:leader peptidase (prepilin peptidase)/N-methyltransferase